MMPVDLLPATDAGVNLEALQQSLKDAESALVKARARTESLSKTGGAISGAIKDLNAKIKAARLRAFNCLVEEKAANAKPLFIEADKLLAERNNLVATLSYATSFLGNDAILAELEAEVAEREASGRLFEAQAMDQRNRALAAMSAAVAVDPGFSIDFKGGNSQRLLELASDCWKQARIRREDLAKKQKEVESEQSLAAPSLFNV